MDDEGLPLPINRCFQVYNLGDTVHYTHLLQGECGELWKANSNLRMELDRTNERVPSLQRSLATVSVEFLALQEQFSHFTDCHWAPLQHFHSHLTAYFTSPPINSDFLVSSPSSIISSSGVQNGVLISPLSVRSGSHTSFPSLLPNSSSSSSSSGYSTPPEFIYREEAFIKVQEGDEGQALSGL